jgi:hypothetical protein
LEALSNRRHDHEQLGCTAPSREEHVSVSVVILLATVECDDFREFVECFHQGSDADIDPGIHGHAGFLVRHGIPPTQKVAERYPSVWNFN